MKVFFHIYDIREPENQSCHPNNLSNKDDLLELQVHKSASTIYQYSSTVVDIQLHLMYIH
jgi:hypothetical protein